VLDGTWAQAKTMWWRNPWLLKLKRLVLNPSRRSLYGRLRKEPRRECLSTIESVAEALQTLGEDPIVSDALRNHFAELLRKYQARDAVKPPSEA
jgi:DTW domain-containing protein YfiP